MNNKITVSEFFKKFNQLQRAGILFLIFLSLATVKPTNTFAQTGLPAGSCGIEYIYDAVGNMVERQYICNNSSSSSSMASIHTLKSQNKTSSVQAVTTLYPNPTTGKFSIKMVKPLQNTQVEIVNVQGSVIFKSMMNGTLLQFDLSGKPSGTYFRSFRYFNNHVPDVFDRLPWDNNKYPRRYNPNWYWIFSHPPIIFSWWLFF